MSTALPRRRGAAAALALALLAAGCGSAAAPGQAPAAPPVSLPLATSVTVGQVTWAVIPMGAAAGANQFWQLLALPAGGTRWTLATPPDVATNGAIALGGPASQGGQSLVAGIHPSLLLGFSPVTITPDGGRTWTAGPPDHGLANVPDALAVAPGGSQLIALNRDGSAELGRAALGTAQLGAGGAWTRLAGTRTLAATSAGRACGLTALTAAAFSPSGQPVLGGTCTRAGVAGIFGSQDGAWHAAGPAVRPAGLRGQRIEVIRLVRTGSRLTALLQAGAGRGASLLAAWNAGAAWSLSPALRLAGRPVTASSLGADGAVAVTLGGGRGELLTGPGASWQSLPALPRGATVTLALPAGGGLDALAADRGLLTVWRLSQAAGGAAAWVRSQQVRVPIQYGSSS